MPVEVALGPVDFYDHDLRECFSSFPCPTDRRKLILPKLGGTPQVWNTCMVFFQSVLLMGYAYTHWVSTKLKLRQQLMLHGCVLLVPILLMGYLIATGPEDAEGVSPFYYAVKEWSPPAGSNPIVD